MPKALPPAIRHKIINFDPVAPSAVSISRFCYDLGISRRVFYTIRDRFSEESAAALHPHSSAPLTVQRRYGDDTTRELIRLRKKLKAAGWVCGAAIGKWFSGDRKVPFHQSESDPPRWPAQHL